MKKIFMSNTGTSSIDNTVARTLGDIMQNFPIILDYMFGKSLYFQRTLKNTYGIDCAQIITRLIIEGYIDKEQYKKISKISFDLELDITQLNEGLPLIFNTETFLKFLGELKILYETRLSQYRVYELLESKESTKKLTVIGKGNDFVILLNPDDDSYFLHINGNIFLEKELIWEQNEDEVTLKQIIFTGDGITFVYSLENMSFDTFPYTLHNLFEIENKTYLYLISKNKAIISSIDSGFSIQGNFILKAFVETGTDILFITNEFKINNAGKKREFFKVFSKNLSQEILDFRGEVLQVIEHSTGVYITYEQEDFVDTDTGVQTQSYIVCEQILETGTGTYESKIVLKILYKIQKYSHPGEKESFSRMKVDIFYTKDDIFARIAYFAGNIESDTPIYDIVSLNRNRRITGIRKVLEFRHSDAEMNIEYIDMKGDTHTFNSAKEHQKYNN